MRIAVIGATGRTGRQVVAQALARGHAVTAVTRHPQSITVTDPCLERAQIGGSSRSIVWPI